MKTSFKIVTAFFLLLLLLSSASTAFAQQLDNDIFLNELAVEEDDDIAAENVIVNSCSRFERGSGGNGEREILTTGDLPKHGTLLPVFYQYHFQNTPSLSAYALALLNSSHTIPYYLLFQCSKVCPA